MTRHGKPTSRPESEREGLGTGFSCDRVWKEPRTKALFRRISRRQASDVKLLLIGSERSDSFRSKKLLEEFAAFRFAHSSSDFALMVERRHLQQVDHTSGSACLWVGASENHSSHPGLDNCSRAHR